MHRDGYMEQSELIRCTACRGRKRVEKLGGVIGDCNTCNGEGKIKLVDKPAPVASVADTNVSDVINAVSRVTPNQIDDVNDVKPAANTASKRAVFKRKSKE